MENSPIYFYSTMILIIKNNIYKILKIQCYSMLCNIQNIVKD